MIIYNIEDEIKEVEKLFTEQTIELFKQSITLIEIMIENTRKKVRKKAPQSVILSDKKDCELIIKNMKHYMYLEEINQNELSRRLNYTPQSLSVFLTRGVNIRSSCVETLLKLLKEYIEENEKQKTA